MLTTEEMDAKRNKEAIVIAEFMGEKISKSKIGIEAPAGFDLLFQYHSSWSWIMPVVIKIESLSISCLADVGYRSASVKKIDCRFIVDIRDVQCKIHRISSIKTNENEENFLGIEDFIGIRKIDSVYMAVVKFIEWYNDQQKC